MTTDLVGTDVVLDLSGGAIRVTQIQDALGNTVLDTTNGSVTLDEGVTFLGAIATDDTTDSTSGTTGSIQTDGGIGATKAIVSASSIKSTSATAGVGYATGAGGTVTQATSRTTGVTLNTVTGQITLVSAAGSTTPASFTVTNSAVAATDVIVLNQVSGTDLYDLDVTAVGAGSFDKTFNTKSGTTTEQPVISFAFIKGVTS